MSKYCWCDTTSNYHFDAECPTFVPVYRSSPIGSPAFQTFLGATQISTPASFYKFPDFVSDIPLCQSVLQYNVFEVAPAGKLSFPSASCSGGGPCDKIDVDVTAAPLDIFFKIEVITLLDVSSTAQTHISGPHMIQVTETP